MPPRAARVDPGRVPSDFDEMIEWTDRWSEGLVLLAEYPLPELRRAVDAVRGSVAAHAASLASRLGDDPPGRGASDARALLRADHAWFAISVDQFDWFLRVVEGEDHGGHRQALGQYGRLLAEALRRHRRLEVEYLGPDSRRRPPRPTGPARKQ
jgi:hypothetical protein